MKVYSNRPPTTPCAAAYNWLGDWRPAMRQHGIGVTVEGGR